MGGNSSETYPEMCLYTIRVIHGNRNVWWNPEETQEAARGMTYEDRGLKKRGNRSECMGDLAGKQARIMYGEHGGMYEQNQYTGECSRIALNMIKGGQTRE